MTSPPSSYQEEEEKSFHSVHSSPSSQSFQSIMESGAATPSTIQDDYVVPSTADDDQESIATTSDTARELQELERVVESLPDSPTSSSHQSLVTQPPNAISPSLSSSPPAVNTSGIQVDGPASGSGEPRQLEDWLRITGQSLGAATTATSTGFNVARGVTSISLNIAKRLTQVAVALPALALDSMNGSVPGSDSATASVIAHQTVNGFFNLISTLAIGGIDLGSTLTTTGLITVTNGLEGLNKILGSEVIKSLGQFVKLVQREWNADNDNLPPGGLPPFGLTGVSRALIVWISIQLVTHKQYEDKMMKHLQEFDLVKIRNDIDTEHKDMSSRVQNVRITSENIHESGEVIGAEVGQQRHNDGNEDFVSDGSGGVVQPLSEKEAVRGLLRYSSMVLAVYGGVALAWLGSLPQDQDTSTATAPPRPSAPSNGLDPSRPLPADGLTRQQDEEQFLLAASMMDLTEQQRDEAQMQAESKQLREGKSNRMPPGAFDGQNGEVLFTNPELDSTASSSVDASRPAPGTPSGPATSSTATTTPSTTTAQPPRQTASSYSYLNLISGQHDEELFHRVGNLQRENVHAGSYAELGSDRRRREEQSRPTPPPQGGKADIARPSQPRYYVVTDHAHRKIVLVLRGSLTLGDIATDLTCESREFYFPDAASRQNQSGQKQSQAEGDSSVRFPAEEASTSARASHYAPNLQEEEEEVPLVHEGMYETALLVGSVHAPVHRAVRLALESQPSYNLDIAGHSLGAGVASILAILWANPETTHLTSASGLPTDRKLHAYCYATPCTMSPNLSRRSSKLITSYVYSFDLVCRLSLGTIQDIRNASAWLLYEDQHAHLSSTSSDDLGFQPLRVPKLLSRAFEYQSGRLDSNPEFKTEIEQNFLALRKSLEANMTNVELYPPGQIIYLLPKKDLLNTSTGDKEVMAYTVNGKVEKVFDQIIFSRNLLSCHMPSVYHRALRGLKV
ncbi:unnamed protein product [Sympodiomycopsis kandeliae]